MNISNLYVPAALTEYFDIRKSFMQAEEMLQSLKDNSRSGLYETDIAFMEQAVSDLDRERAEKEVAARSIIDRLSDPITHTAASLHYLIGHSWQEVSEILGCSSVDAIKASVYRGLLALSDEE